MSANALAGEVRLAWEPISQTELTGYRLHYGAASRGYDTTVDVGNVTECAVTGLGPGTYYFAVTAYGSLPESGYSNEVSATIPAPDNAPPTVTITSPTTSPAWVTSSGSVSIGESASDNVGVAQVTWWIGRGGNGGASGTADWSIAGITLQAGANVITVAARDAAGNSSSGTLTVTCTPPRFCANHFAPAIK